LKKRRVPEVGDRVELTKVLSDKSKGLQGTINELLDDGRAQVVVSGGVLTDSRGPNHTCWELGMTFRAPIRLLKLIKRAEPYKMDKKKIATLQKRYKDALAKRKHYGSLVDEIEQEGQNVQNNTKIRIESGDLTLCLVIDDEKKELRVKAIAKCGTQVHMDLKELGDALDKLRGFVKK